MFSFNAREKERFLFLNCKQLLQWCYCCARTLTLVSHAPSGVSRRHMSDAGDVYAALMFTMGHESVVVPAASEG